MIKKKLLLIQLNEINFQIAKQYSNNIDFKFFNKDFFKKLFITDSESRYELLGYNGSQFIQEKKLMNIKFLD